MFLRRIIISLAVLIATAVMAVPSVLGAVGSGDKLSTDSIVRGSLLTTSSSSGAILSGEGLVPGSSVRGSVTISNSGTLAGRYSLGATITGSSQLAGVLRLVVRELHDKRWKTVYTGPLAGLDGTALGVFGAADSRTYVFQVSFPSTPDDNTLQGLSAGASFTWSATAA
jgi:hypothetical protein